MKITIYTTPVCPYCVIAKQYFNEKKLTFEEIDVAADKSKAEEMVKISGQMEVPVIQIDGKVIIGFDQDKIEKALG